MRPLLSYVAVALLAAAAAFAVAPVIQPRPALPPPAPEAERPLAQQVEPPPVWTPAPPLAAPPSLEPLDVSPEEQSNIHVYQRCNRGVVNITTRSVQADDFFLLTSPREGSGSGSVLDPQGHILTNYHVIGDTREISVTLFDGSTLEARLVGSDPHNDLAILQVKAAPEKLFPIIWGDSNKLQVGMRVFAIGNPFGLERTLTTGIVSSLNRSLRTESKRLVHGVIQTDAAINPGNSGGPLLNRRGELIGITTAIISRAGQSSGVGLAVPANTARRIVADLIHYGRVIRPGCGISHVVETDQGVSIARLVPGGSAERAGLRGLQVTVTRRGGFESRRLDRSQADVIVAVDGRPMKTLDDLIGYVESKKPGDKVTFTVVRQGETLEVPVELEQARN